jgi:bile acid:Na+ symporter, BASS family
MTATLLLILKLAVVALIFATGLGSTPADVSYLWRRPSELLRSLFAMYVAVPLAAVLVAKTLPLPVAVKVAILVLAISAGAPLLPRRLMKVGRDGYVFSLVVSSSLLAVVAVPTWLAILDLLFEQEATIEPAKVARLIAKSFLAPLLLGMALRRPFSGMAERLSEWLLGAAGAVLSAAGLVLLVLNAQLLLAVGWGPLLALCGMTVMALAIGHMFGGPAPEDRTALAVSCATRHVGVAMLAASTVPGPRTVSLILAYVLAAAIISIPYLSWRKRMTAVIPRPDP